MRRIGLLLLCLATTAVAAAGGTSWRRIDEPLVQRGTATEPRFDAFHRGMVEALRPQSRAERLLQLAMNGYEGAADYTIANAQSWRGGLEPTPTLESLLEGAISSPRLEVRMAAIEVALARSDLDRTPAQVDALMAQRRMDPDVEASALWSLGAIGASGVDRARIAQELDSALRDADATRRVAAVEAVAVFGGAESIDPLLAIAAHDPDAHVQERAFCALAQSATLHIAERYAALPGLLAIAEGERTATQRRDWSFQAMREISGFPEVADDAAAWRRALDAAELSSTIAR